MGFERLTFLLALASVGILDSMSLEGVNPDNPFLQGVVPLCSDRNTFIKMTSCADRKGCVPTVRVCDGKDDCGDGSDETKSACQQVHDTVCTQMFSSNSSQFECKYGAPVDRDLVCDGHGDCPDGSDELECKRCFCKTSKGYFQCEYGACVDKEKRCDGHKDCADGSDEEDCDTKITATTTKKPKPSPKSCKLPPHPPHGQNYILCTKGDDEAVCRGEPGHVVKHDTMMVTTCSLKYLLASGDGYSVCNNGHWTPPQHTCIECGLSGKDFNPTEELSLIRNGESGEVGDFPWMAALYHRSPSDMWEQACGGTLISPHIVLTAAHCVKLPGKPVLQPEDIQVGLGKIFRDYYRKESSAVMKTVREVVIPKRYVGSLRHYDMDIALLDLTAGVPISNTIRPACIDLSGKLKLRNGLLGYLAGWGTNEFDRPSTELQWARQKYLDYDTCLDKITSKKNLKYITHDKFCIDTVKGSKADKGDSGGPLTFTIDNIHFVFGVVSTSLPKGEEPVVLFTNVANTQHRIWIKDNQRRLTNYH